ncbi:MAG: inverse autotransporter beta domain-containing protein, partial [Candidatus Omnitrophica bacterium]|nr:inverse autotransporter beta domain-containing protein [Candidatus Omnitrophota bacterium]
TAFAFFSLFISPVSAQNNDKDFPAWLKRIELSTKVETHQKPTVYFQTVQPLYQDEGKINTFFIQPRINKRVDKTTYNFGTGYRRMASQNLILGLNVFGDYQDLHQHGRVGVGAEALGQILEARVNTYFGVTGKRNVEESSSVTVFERAADGVDYELGAPVPYVPWLKVFGSGFWYDLDKFSDKVGWKGRLEARLSTNIRAEFFTWDDNKGSQEYGGQLRFSVAFNTWKDIRDAFKFSDQPFPTKDLSEQILDPVERNFDIVVEKWTETPAGLTVEAGRT